MISDLRLGLEDERRSIEDRYSKEAAHLGDISESSQMGLKAGHRQQARLQALGQMMKNSWPFLTIVKAGCSELL